MTAKQIHVLAQKIKETIQEKYGVLLTIGIYAVITADREIVQMQESITSMVEALPGVLQAHGMFIDMENKRLSFVSVIIFPTGIVGIEAVNNVFIIIVIAIFITILAFPRADKSCLLFFPRF